MINVEKSRVKIEDARRLIDLGYLGIGGQYNNASIEVAK